MVVLVMNPEMKIAEFMTIGSETYSLSHAFADQARLVPVHDPMRQHPAPWRARRRRAMGPRPELVHRFAAVQEPDGLLQVVDWGFDRLRVLWGRCPLTPAKGFALGSHHRLGV